MIETLPYRPPADVLNVVLDNDTLYAAARNIAESNTPRPGYPALLSGYPDGRLFMTSEAVLKNTHTEEVYALSDGTLTKIWRVTLTPGHDTRSDSEFLADPSNVSNLIYPPVPDIVTGSEQKVNEATFQMWLDMGFRVFDQHNRVMPGSWKRRHSGQLLFILARGGSAMPAKNLF
jgi:hypothetical protein